MKKCFIGLLAPFLIAVPLFAAQAGQKIVSPLDEHPELARQLEPLLEHSVWAEHRLVGDNMDLAQVTVFMLADAPRDKVWEIITDYGGYSKLHEKIVDVSVKQLGKNHFRVKLEAEAPLSNVIFDQEHKWIPPGRVLIRPAGNERSRTYAIWRLAPSSDGTKTIIALTTVSDLKRQNWILKKLIEALPEVNHSANWLNAFVQIKGVLIEAERRAGTRPPKGDKQ